jgi:hypothetical protein
MNDRIIEKIQKTLRLAENAGATPAEAERAMSQVNKLLAKHNLSLADLATTQETIREDLIVEFQNTPAVRRIANAIAQLYFCEYLFFKGTNRHLFVGEQANVATTAGMVEFVLEIMSRGSKNAAKTAMFKTPSAAKTAYIHGFADAVVYRAFTLVEENRAHRGNSTGTGTALVLADQYEKEKEANQALITEKYGKTKAGKARKRTKLDYDAYKDGYSDGTKVGLNTQLTD